MTNESAILGLIAELYQRNVQLIQENIELAAEVQRLYDAIKPAEGETHDDARSSTD